MEKILAEYRRTVGDFELVDIDEQHITSLRRELDVDVPIDLHWTWNYGSEVEELRSLYERGKRGQWNAVRTSPTASSRARCSMPANRPASPTAWC